MITPPKPRPKPKPKPQPTPDPWPPQPLEVRTIQPRVVRAIRDRAKAGESIAEIAEDYALSRSIVRRLVGSV